MMDTKALVHNGLRPFIVLAIIASTLWAFSPAYAVPRINNAPGVTLNGYDAVAYVTERSGASQEERIAA